MSITGRLARPGAGAEDPRRSTSLEAEYNPLRVFAWATVVGALAGLVGTAFRLLVARSSYVRRALMSGFGLHGVASLAASVSLGAVLAAAALFLVRHFAPEAAGSGVQEIEGALDGLRPLRWWRVIPVKFFGGLLAIGGGMVLGREGPTIQLGGNFGRMIADRWRLPAGVSETLVAAGAGAGLAAAFNAPLAGVLFVLEEMRPQFEYTFVSVQSVVIACGVADVVVRMLTGQGPVISIIDFHSPPVASLWLFPILGAVFGLLGLLFNRLLIRTLDFFAGLKGWRYRTTGLLVGGLIGLLGWLAPGSIGSGDELVPHILAQPLTVLVLAGLFVLRFGTTLVSYGSGAPGGIFAPMLALGTIFGMTYGWLVGAVFPHLMENPGVFAVAGMGALFTATVRAPITGIALAIEITANYEQILPLLLTCAMATIVAEFLGSEPVYSLLLRRSLARDGERKKGSEG